MENFKLPKIADHGGDLSQRWYVEYYFKHPETNKHVKFREWISSKLLTRTARYNKAAEIKNQISIKLKSGWSPFLSETRNKTISQAIDVVLQIKNATCGQRAKSSYKSLCGVFTDYLDKHKLNSLAPNELNKAICQNFIDYLITKKQLKNRTVNNHVAALRTVFDALLERDFVDFNVWKKIKKLKTTEADISSFSRAERLIISEQLPKDNYQLYCISLLIYYCYLRPAEIMRLKISDLDLIKGQIIIKASQSKNGRNQVVIMHNDLINALTKLNLDQYPENYFVFSNFKKFTPSQTPTAPTRIADAWREIVKNKYGITKNIYDLKPTGAGEAFESGIDARQIQLQVRHSSLEQTQIYLNKYNNKPGQVFRDKMPQFAINQ